MAHSSVRKFGLLVIIASTVLLSACVNRTAIERPVVVDAEEQDRGPDREVDVSHIPNAVPVRENVKLAGNVTPYTVLGKTYHVNFDTRDFSETGYASWYGKKFHGRKTSNGEVYDMYAMTAAHKTLPIPSFVKVTNLENDRSVVVRVNDRGPFHDGRVIDLSYTAAKQLGFHNQGTALVQVDIIAGPDAAQSADSPGDGAAGELHSYLQAGAFSREGGATLLKQRLVPLTEYPVEIRPEPKRGLFRVVIGPIADTLDLMTLRQKLLDTNLSEPHIVELN